MRLYTNWDDGDQVEVVSGNTVVGTLTVSITGNNTAFAQLDGKLATIALKYDYAEGSTNVKSVSGGNVVFESTTLSSLQAIAKFIFKTNS